MEQNMDSNQMDIDAIVQAVLDELIKSGELHTESIAKAHTAQDGELVIDLPDPTTPEARRKVGVKNPYNADGLRNLSATTTARIGVGRAGTRPKTGTLLLFQADHGVTQDAIMGL
jgi:ethanolamine ammonia-lyase small subunit